MLLINCWLLSCGSVPSTKTDTGSDAIDRDADGFQGDDCDDEDPSIHPGAVETADGVDQDCDGLIDEGTGDYDDDGDGWTEVGGDCDDASSGTYPGAVEEGECDGIDQDCDATVEPCVRAESAFAKLSGGGVLGMGSLVRGAGDLTGDGAPDVVVGGSHLLVYAVPGDGGRLEPADAPAWIVTEKTFYRFGAAVVPDSDGGPVGDLLVGASSPGEQGFAYLLDGPILGTLNAAAVARATFVGASEDAAGRVVGGSEDATGDSVSDLLVGASIAGSSAVYLLAGDVSGTVGPSDALAQVAGELGGYSFDDGAVFAGDNDGDGLTDLLVAEGGDADVTRVGWFAGGLAGSLRLTDADALLEDPDGQLRPDTLAGGGDWDADGLADVALVWGYTEAQVLLFSGAPGHGATRDDAAGRIQGEDDFNGPQGYSFGYSLAFVDADGDGLDDLLAGAPGSDLAGGEVTPRGDWQEASGATGLYLAPFSGTLAMRDADELWVGEGYSQFGSSVAGMQDMDGDGIDEIIMGAPYYEAPDGGWIGAAYVFLGQSSW